MVDLKCKESTLKYMTDGVRYICENFKRRAGGSQSERDAQAYLKTELEKYSDDVIMEDFKVHPHAFMGFISICVTFSMIASAIFWFLPNSDFMASLSDTAALAIIAIAPLLMIVCLFMGLFEFLFYKEFVDFLFPARVSRNVYATRKPTGEVKKRIIFGGHTDAAFEWTYSYIGEMKVVLPVMISSVACMFGVFFITGAFLLKSVMTGSVIAYAGTGWDTWAIILGVMAPIICTMYLFINWRVIVDGANDNLSANFISIAIMKELHDADIRFENTEVGCLLSGSEEAGLRGAKAFAKTHQKELQETETVFIALDTMREIEQLQIYTRGCTGTIGDCEAVGDLIHEAGLKCNIDMKRAAFYPGALDSEAFAEYGIRSAGMCAVNHDTKRYYHTRQDTWTNMDPECLKISYDICVEALKLYDASGIRSYEDARTAKGLKNKAFPDATMN